MDSDASLILNLILDVIHMLPGDDTSLLQTWLNLNVLLYKTKT